MNTSLIRRPLEHSRRHWLALAAALGLGLGAAGLPDLAAAAGSTPARILVPFPAGGSFDATARILADKLSVELQRPVLVDNKPGASGRLVMDYFKRAPADGSVMVLGSDGLVVMFPLTMAKLSYDPDKDLVPVGTVGEFPFALSTSPASPYKTVPEYVAWLKANPQRADYGIPVLGAPHHFFGMQFGKAIGVQMVNVPYQGSAPLLTETIGGQVSASIDVVGGLIEPHRAGKLRMLAVTTPKRLALVPDVPTFAELGYPDMVGTGFNGLYAPPGTPAAVVRTWSQALMKVMAMPDVKEKLLTLGTVPGDGSTEDLRERAARGMRLWAPIVKASGFRLD